jgi:hypothetical protein
MQLQYIIGHKPFAILKFLIKLKYRSSKCLSSNYCFERFFIHENTLIDFLSARLAVLALEITLRISVVELTNILPSECSIYHYIALQLV